MPVGNCVKSILCRKVRGSDGPGTPRKDELRQLESARRAMLRRIVGLPRGADEQWLSWIQRSTHHALAAAKRVGLTEWGHTHYERKWNWAGHIARRDAHSWLHKVTFWRDSAWQLAALELPNRFLRPERRRWMKFEDPLRRYCTVLALGPWSLIAPDRPVWSTHAKPFSTSF